MALHPSDRSRVYWMLCNYQPKRRRKGFPVGLAFLHAGICFGWLSVLPAQVHPIMLAINYVISLNIAAWIWLFIRRRFLV